MRIITTLFISLLLSISAYANDKAHCAECDKNKSICVCLVPAYVGIFHWNFDSAIFDISFDVDGHQHHYTSFRELHKDYLDSIDIELLKDGKVSDVHYELTTINGSKTEGCVIDMPKIITGKYLVTINRHLSSFSCDIKFES